MGINQYFNDMLQCYIDNEIPYPLSAHATFDMDKFLEIKGHDEVDLCIIFQVKRLEQLSKTLLIKFYDSFNSDGQQKYFITISEEKIVLHDNYGEDSYLLSKDSLFNFNIEHHIPFNIQDLEQIQTKFIELCNTSVYTKFVILYTYGEEKYYGY